MATQSTYEELDWESSGSPLLTAPGHPWYEIEDRVTFRHDLNKAITKLNPLERRILKFEFYMGVPVTLILVLLDISRHRYEKARDRLITKLRLYLGVESVRENRKSSKRRSNGDKGSHR